MGRNHWYRKQARISPSSVYQASYGHDLVWKDPPLDLDFTVIAISGIDTDKGENLRLRTGVRDDSKVYIEGWHTTKIYGAMASVLKLPSRLSTFRSGVTHCDRGNMKLGWYDQSASDPFSTDPSSNSPLRVVNGSQPSNACFYDETIIFKAPFDSPPTVLCWLNFIDLGNQAHFRLGVEARDVSAVGFTIRFVSWQDSRHAFYGAKASWVAFPTDAPNVVCGTFAYGRFTMHTADDNPPFKAVKFPEKKFSAAPSVFVAISKIDFSNLTNPRLTVFARDVTKQEANICINSWHDTKMHMAQASYIAIAGEEYASSN